jgi:site-specific DNA-methyltransferase (adenine-specific)
MDNKTTELMFSSGRLNWSTPQDFFDKLDGELGPFTLDACASKENTKCEKYYSSKDDSLKQDWSENIVFCNPPYGRGIKYWIKKGYEESLKNNTKVVMLIPSRTDTKYWHEYVMRAQEIRFVKGRLKFGNSSNSAPFPSAVVVFNSGPSPSISTMQNRGEQ